MGTIPEPPTGVDDLHNLPYMASDRELYSLEEVLAESLPDDIFERLTRFVDDPPEEATDEFRLIALEYVRECQQYRDDIRPDSLRPLSDLPDTIDRTTGSGWVGYTASEELDQPHDVPESNATETKHGKYLFFAPEDVRQLETIVLEQFQQRPFDRAKLPTKPAKRDDWVLCLYDGDNRYWHVLKDGYDNPPTIRFRGYKTNEATHRGEYSDRFLETLEEQSDSE